jgi:hypothetical protein
MAAFPARSPGSRGALLLVAALLFLAAAPGLAAARRSKKSYKAIFSFGDSLSDAGNILVNGTPKALTTARPPYGMTFFGKPNGRLVVDFLGMHSLRPPGATTMPSSSSDLVVLFYLLSPLLLSK